MRKQMNECVDKVKNETTHSNQESTLGGGGLHPDKWC